MLRGLWYFYLHRVELQTARELGEHLLTLAQQVGDPALLLEAHYALGNTLNYLGEFAATQAHLAQGIALYDPQRHRSHAVRLCDTLMDEIVATMGMLAREVLPVGW